MTRKHLQGYLLCDTKPSRLSLPLPSQAHAPNATTRPVRGGAYVTLGTGWGQGVVKIQATGKACTVN